MENRDSMFEMIFDMFVKKGITVSFGPTPGYEPGIFRITVTLPDGQRFIQDYDIWVFKGSVNIDLSLHWALIDIYRQIKGRIDDV